jgi:hypothetical protein
MQRLLFLISPLFVLVGCASSQPYTAQDLREVKSTYEVLVPLYVQFRAAYQRGDGSAMAGDYRREQRICRTVDAVDQRDTIDPNTNLFQVSAGLDNLCNDIESVYAAWEKEHHRPYPKDIVPAFLSEAFEGSDLQLKKMREQLRHPASLS